MASETIVKAPNQTGDSGAAQPDAVLSGNPIASSSRTSGLELTLPEPDETRSLVERIILKESLADAVVALKGLAEHVQTSELTSEFAYYSFGAPLPIINAMRKFQSNEEVQYWACACLVWMPGTIDAKISTLHCGGLEALMDAVKVHSASLGVLDASFVAIGNIFTIPDARSLHYVHRFVEELDGVGIVVSTMKRYPDDTFLQGSACKALHSVSQMYGPRGKVMDAVGVVGLAIEKHRQDKNVQTFGRKFMAVVYSHYRYQQSLPHNKQRS